MTEYPASDRHHPFVGCVEPPEASERLKEGRQAEIGAGDDAHGCDDCKSPERRAVTDRPQRAKPRDRREQDRKPKGPKPGDDDRDRRVRLGAVHPYFALKKVAIDWVLATVDGQPGSPAGRLDDELDLAERRGEVGLHRRLVFDMPAAVHLADDVTVLGGSSRCVQVVELLDASARSANVYLH